MAGRVASGEAAQVQPVVPSRARGGRPVSMEADVDRAQKQAFVTEMHDVFKQTTCVVVTHYSGLNVAAMSDLRRRMQEAGATFRVTKNRLSKLALEDTPFDSLADLLQGPTAIAYSDDPVAPAKIAVEFAKSNDKLVVLGGALAARRLAAADVEALAKLPSLDVLRGLLIGLVQAPATKVARVLQAPAEQLARLAAAYGASEEAA
jgi:large subunit ribosomal protein L10